MRTKFGFKKIVNKDKKYKPLQCDVETERNQEIDTRSTSEDTSAIRNSNKSCEREDIEIVTKENDTNKKNTRIETYDTISEPDNDWLPNMKTVSLMDRDIGLFDEESVTDDFDRILSKEISFKSIDFDNILKTVVQTEKVPTTVPSSEKINPILLKTNGLFISDPNQNGEIFNLNKNNRSLTNKDLYIVRGSEGADDDDKSVVSNVTEVTYAEKSRRTRISMILKSLRSRAAQDDEGFLATLSKTFQCYDDEHELEVLKLNRGKMSERLIKENGDDTDNMNNSFADDAILFLQSFFAFSTNSCSDVDFGSFDDTVSVSITNVYMATAEELALDKRSSSIKDLRGIRCSWNEPKLSHDLGVRLVEGDSGQAIVREVTKQSVSFLAGVRKGDVLSFAVPLNNAFQGYDRACDFITKLEAIGMRTSYREMFDMLLSKSCAGWPIAIVFRRNSPGIQNWNRISSGMPSINFQIDIKHSSDLIHELITKSREHDFEREARGNYEIIRGNIERFMSRPRLRMLGTDTITTVGESIHDLVNSFGRDKRYLRTPFFPTAEEGFEDLKTVHPTVRRSSIVTGSMEQALTILYLRFSPKYNAGSGLMVSRVADGSWSAPLSIGATVSDSILISQNGVTEYVILSGCADWLREFKQREKITLECSQNTPTDNLIVISKCDECFFWINSIILSIYEKRHINEQTYNSVTDDFSARSILGGTIPNPHEAEILYGALRRGESPSNMYPHVTPPTNLSKFASNAWFKQDSCYSSTDLDPPFEDDGCLLLRQVLCEFQEKPLVYIEECKEFEMFQQKFKQMLFDGLTIDGLHLINKNTKSNMEHEIISEQENDDVDKIVLKLHLLPNESLQNGRLSVTLHKKITPSKGGHFKQILDSSYISKNIEVDMSKIVKLSHSGENEVIVSPSSLHCRTNNRKKLVSIETESIALICVARNGKDADLLLCGLKLLLEQLDK